MKNLTDPAKLKEAVHDYWNANACGANKTSSERYAKAYFDEIENYRYSVEPEILPFAQFAHFRGKKVLEIGTGSGTDFIQWVRAGAMAYGIDLTGEAVEHTKKRLEAYGLRAEEVKVADCENLPYDDSSFDLVYSWGVIHHTPDMRGALREIVRVTRPGGMCKIMVYNRHSLHGFFLWVKKALLKGRPWRSFFWCIHNYLESAGTKAVTKREMDSLLRELPVEKVSIRSVLTYYDRLENKNILFKFTARGLSTLLGGDRAGFFMTIQFTKAA